MLNILLLDGHTVQSVSVARALKKTGYKGSYRSGFHSGLYADISMNGFGPLIQEIPKDIFVS